MPTYSITELDEAIITDDIGPGDNLTPSLMGGLNYIFPSNIGQSFQGHWLRLNIYAPNTGQATPIVTRGINAINNAVSGLGGITDIASAVDAVSTAAGNVATATKNYYDAISGGQQLTSNPNTIISQNLRPAQLQASIILAMPQSNMVFSSHNKYEEVSITALQFGLPAAIAAAGVRALSGKGTNLFNVVNSVGTVAGQLTSLAGYPLNPQLEILFTGRGQRQFQFEVMMTPTNKDEAESIRNIIKTLRSTSSPQRGVGPGGFLMVPPSTYDITFFKDGKENENIPKIKQCALQVIEVDYSPSGTYSTFSTGHPVEIRLSLGFREIEVLFQDDVQKGY